MAPAALKNTADPPGASAVSPNGAYTESSAIEPTTSRLTSHPIRGADPQESEAAGAYVAHGRRQAEPRRLFGLAEHAVLAVPSVPPARRALARLLEQVAQGDELARALREAHFLAAPHHPHQLHQLHVVEVGRVPQRLHRRPHPADVAVMIGPQHVDRPRKAALVLRAVI